MDTRRLSKNSRAGAISVAATTSKVEIKQGARGVAKAKAKPKVKHVDTSRWTPLALKYGLGRGSLLESRGKSGLSPLGILPSPSEEVFGESAQRLYRKRQLDQRKKLKGVSAQ